MKKDSQLKDYFLVWISSMVIAACYFITNLYGWDIRFIILFILALIVFGVSANRILKIVVPKGSIEEKQYNIEMNDERNTLLREKAGAKTNQYMLYLLTIILFVLIYMKAEFWVILLIGLLAAVQGILAFVLYDHYAKKY